MTIRSFQDHFSIWQDTLYIRQLSFYSIKTDVTEESNKSNDGSLKIEKLVG